MADMTEFSKKEFPSQTRERLQWQLDAIRANQSDVAAILHWLTYPFDGKLIDGETREEKARKIYQAMHKHDRDGITRQGGIFTDEQIEVLNEPI